MLLQPERINAYAQAVIQTLREDPLERGCIAEDPTIHCINCERTISALG